MKAALSVVAFGVFAGVLLNLVGSPELSTFQNVLLPLCSSLDWILSWAAGTLESAETNIYLQGNFGPVLNETEPTSLTFTGTLPPDLSGVFIRNGPNNRFPPKGGYHWFDGDSMVHTVRIRDGSLTYSSRYTQTQKLQTEEKFGSAQYSKIGDMVGVIGFMKVLFQKVKTAIGYLPNLSQSLTAGTANTAFVFHNNELMALVESSLPFVLNIKQNGDIESVGFKSYNGNLSHPFTAHPKVDPKTGEMMFFGYILSNRPYCIYSVVSKEGDLIHSAAIDIMRPLMMHDMAITEHYSIFLDLPLVFKPQAMVKGEGVFQFNKTLPSRFGVMPRFGDNSDIKWFETESCMIFHVLNAWEDGDVVVMYAHVLNDFNLYDAINIQQKLTEFRFHMKDGTVSKTEISQLSTDFPQVSRSHAGYTTRYGFAATGDHGMTDEGHNLFGGVAKFDLIEKMEVGQIVFGEGRISGETVFALRNGAVDEDDGYLITILQDTNQKHSEFVIFDAKTMSSKPVVSAIVPTRVPYGFHAFFLAEEELNSQNK